jgi:DNA-binding XRE family transcriptional regulator
MPIIIEHEERAMVKRKNDFDEFMKEVEEESAAAGESAALAAYGEHFRLALAVIQLRKKQRWTQQQLAKASGVQQSEISRIERGQGNPTYRTLQALAQAAQMTVTFVASKPAAGRGASRLLRNAPLASTEGSGL